MKNTTVIVLIGTGSANQRVQKLSSLKKHYKKIIIISVKNNNNKTADYLQVKPYVNPTGIFRLLRLHNLKRYLDKTLYFPTRNILYVKAVLQQLKKLIDKEISKGKVT